MLLTIGIFLLCYAANWHPIVLFLGGVTLICASVTIKERHAKLAHF